MKVKMKKQILVLMTLILGVFVMGGFVMADTTGVATASVTIPGYLSITLDEYALNFGSMNPGQNNKAPLLDPLVVSVGAESNVKVNITTKANDGAFKAGSLSMDVGQMTWTSTEHASPINHYTQTDAEVCHNVIASGTCSMNHLLSIPNGKEAGAYSVGVTITGLQAP